MSSVLLLYIEIQLEIHNNSKCRLVVKGLDASKNIVHLKKTLSNIVEILLVFDQRHSNMLFCTCPAIINSKCLHLVYKQI